RTRGLRRPGRLAADAGALDPPAVAAEAWRDRCGRAGDHRRRRGVVAAGAVLAERPLAPDPGAGGIAARGRRTAARAARTGRAPPRGGPRGGRRGGAAGVRGPAAGAGRAAAGRRPGWL